jgi:hypothetical protein
MRYYISGFMLSLAIVALWVTVASGAVTLRSHKRVLEVPLSEVLTALGHGHEAQNNPRFRIKGAKLLIIVDGAGT